MVENCVLTSREDGVDVDFYIHEKHDVLGQFPKPAPKQIDRYEKVLLPSKSAKCVISEHGDPHYIEIDLENYDSEVLRALWHVDIVPPYISAESHDIEVFALLVSMGYSAFKLVEGATVSRLYAVRVLHCPDGTVTYSFPRHSAGPFGNDVNGRWMTAANFFKLLALEGLGWKDIHASRVEEADPSEMVRLREYFKLALKYQLIDAYRKSSGRVRIT